MQTPPAGSCWGAQVPNPVDPHWPGDVLYLLLAEILESVIELVADVISHNSADADATGLGQGLQPRGDIHAVAEDVAFLDDHVAEIDANAEPDPPLLPHLGLALGHPPLHLDRAAHRIDDAGELDQEAVAGGLDDAAPVLPDLWLNQFV